ncbi:MAG: sugar transferase [Acidimicrobiia bacterium]|nr:sugar transferase [Acidimicrobiia bacterium]
MASPRRSRRTRKELWVGDALLTVATAVMATVLVQGFDGLGDPVPIGFGLAAAAALSVVLWWRNAYVVTRSIKWNGDLALLFSSVLGISLVMVAASWFAEVEPARAWQLLLTGGWLVNLTAFRVILARRGEVHAQPVRVVIVGNSLDALAVRLALRADPRTAYDVQGFVMDRLDDNMPEVVSRLALGSVDQLPHVITKTRAELVVVCLGALDADRFAPLVRELNIDGVDVALSTGLGKVALRRVNLGYVSGRPLVRITAPPLDGGHMLIKRAVDLVGATIALVLSLPVMAMAAIAIRIEDGHRAIFSQERVGKGGEPFTIYKFRTMIAEAEDVLIDLTNDLDGPVFKMQRDPRITRVGAFLRRTSIDELPQLINIIRGEMSLVGPRPLPVREVEAAPRRFLDRQAVKPGLTGRWQVSGRSDAGFDELDELDRWYVDNWSLAQDLEILARTVPAVLLARGAR